MTSTSVGSSCKCGAWPQFFMSRVSQRPETPREIVLSCVRVLVLVVFALQRQQRHADARQPRPGVERLETGRQPGVVPHPERPVHVVAVIPLQAGPQIGAEERVARLPAARDGPRFADDMGANRHHAAQQRRLRSGELQCDGAAVAVSDEQTTVGRQPRRAPAAGPGRPRSAGSAGLAVQATHWIAHSRFDRRRNHEGRCACTTPPESCATARRTRALRGEIRTSARRGRPRWARLVRASGRAAGDRAVRGRRRRVGSRSSGWPAGHADARRVVDESAWRQSAGFDGERVEADRVGLGWPRAQASPHVQADVMVTAPAATNRAPG